MAKIDVVLRAVLDDGKEQHYPDEVVTMEQAEAERAAAMGLVRIIKPAAAKRKAAVKTPDKTQDKTPDGEGGETVSGNTAASETASGQEAGDA